MRVYEWIQSQLQNGISVTAADLLAYLQVLSEVSFNIDYVHILHCEAYLYIALFTKGSCGSSYVSTLHREAHSCIALYTKGSCGFSIMDFLVMS